MEKFSGQLWTDLTEELVIIEHSTILLHEKFSQSIHLIKRALGKLKAEIDNKPFKNDLEEIHFFKKIKPRFYALQVFEHEKFVLVSNLPLERSAQVEYFREELSYIQRFFQHQKIWYSYYRIGANDLDHRYFKRDVATDSLLIAELPGLDTAFHTPGDYLFAKFIAYENIQDHILNLLNPKESKEGLTPHKVLPKTLIDLSVDQLGLITRAADDARLILGKSFSKICNDLAPHIATPETNRISSHSLRSNAYLAENSDKSNVIRTLEKMINFIKGY